MKNILIIYMLLNLNTQLIAMQLPHKKYDEVATQELIEIIETRNGTVGGSDYDKDESAQSIRRLIKEGANPNAISTTGRNALWSAIIFRNKPLLQCLLHKGVNVNQEDGKGDTPLNFAISNMVFEFLKILIAAGADVNHQSTSRFGLGRTPLMRVFHLGSKIKFAIVDTLLRADADVFLQDHAGQTVLHFVAREGDQAMINRFFSFNHCCVLLKDIPEHNGFTPLYIARNNPLILALLQQTTQKVK